MGVVGVQPRTTLALRLEGRRMYSSTVATMTAPTRFQSAVYGHPDCDRGGRHRSTR